MTEYEAGAPIGWHKDRPVYGEAMGVSLLAPSRVPLPQAIGRDMDARFPPARATSCVYLLRVGLRGTEWENSIPAVESLRYSLTFRTLKRKPEGQRRCGRGGGDRLRKPLHRHI